MKKNGLLNAQLSYIIASMGHTDKLVICDSGLPIPNDEKVVDLALVQGIPGFVETLGAILSELNIERAIIADEMEKVNTNIHKQVVGLLEGVEISKVDHEGLKEMTRNNGNIYFVRTGEATPYANIILISGVTFD